MLKKKKKSNYFRIQKLFQIVGVFLIKEKNFRHKAGGISGLTK